MIPLVTTADSPTAAAAVGVNERVTAGGDGGGDGPNRACDVSTEVAYVVVIDNTSTGVTEQVGTSGAGELSTVLNPRLTVGGLAPASLLPMT